MMCHDDRPPSSSIAQPYIGIVCRVVTRLWELPDSRFDRNDHVFALTFDDGPGSFTSSIAEALADCDACATFFPVGSNIESSPETITRLNALGHTIGGHSWSHAVSSTLTDDELIAEHTHTADLLAETTGNHHHLVRPPYGAEADRVSALLCPFGFTTVNWSVDPRDWDGVSAKEIAKSVLMDIHPGAIVILHDGGGNREATLEAVPVIVEVARLMGYEPVAL